MSVSVTVHQKLRAPHLKITHGFISKLDTDLVPLIIRIIQQWDNEEGHWEYHSSWYSVRISWPKHKTTVQTPSLFKHYPNTQQQLMSEPEWQFGNSFFSFRNVYGWEGSQNERCRDKLFSAFISTFRQFVEGTSANVSRLLSSPQNSFKVT